jgi:small subunit ribosomal protein S21
MAVVNVNQGESIESALRRFKRKVMSEEIIKDAKKHTFFMSRGQKAKLKSALARKRNKRKSRPPRAFRQPPVSGYRFSIGTGSTSSAGSKPKTRE